MQNGFSLSFPFKYIHLPEQIVPVHLAIQSRIISIKSS